jgi:excisionase family DNA binding protein
MILARFEWVWWTLNTIDPENNEDERLTLLTAREAAEYLRVSLSTLRRMEQRGRLSSLRTPGGHRRYTLHMLNACLAYEIAAHEVAAHEPAGEMESQL